MGEEVKAQVSSIDQHLECPGYRLGSELGSGSFGKVYKAPHMLSGAEHALKVCSKSSVDDRLEVVQAEIQIMKLLSHSHIIKLHRSCRQRIQTTGEHAPHCCLREAWCGT